MSSRPGRAQDDGSSSLQEILGDIGNLLSMVEAIDATSCINEISRSLVDEFGDLLSGEGPVLEAMHHDEQGVLGIQGQVGVLHQVNLNDLSILAVIGLSGELHIAPAVIGVIP